MLIAKLIGRPTAVGGQERAGEVGGLGREEEKDDGGLLFHGGHAVLGIGGHEQAHGFEHGGGAAGACALQLFDEGVGAVGHGGRRGGHVHRVDAYAMGGVIEGGLAGEAAHGMFAGHVGRIAAQAREGGDRADVHDGATLALKHELAQFSPHGFEQAGGVGGQHGLPVGIRCLVDGVGQEVALALKIERLAGVAAIHHPCGVKGQVEAAKHPHGFRHGVITQGGIHHGARDGDRRMAFVAEASDRLPQLGFLAIHRHDAGPFQRGTKGGGSADACGRAGDEQDLALKAVGGEGVGIGWGDVRHGWMSAGGSGWRHARAGVPHGPKEQAQILMAENENSYGNKCAHRYRSSLFLDTETLSSRKSLMRCIPFRPL